MNKTTLTALTFFGVSATSLLVGNAAQALTFDLYTDRATWQTAVGAATSTENFNSFLSDTSFLNSSLVAGDLTLTNNGSRFDALVDVSPYNGGATGIDGTPMVNARGLELNENITVQLSSSFSAFGFDYENYDGSNDALDVFVGTDLVTSFPATDGAKGFIGFIATDGSFDTVEFRAGTNSFGIFNAFDNVEWGLEAAATTPEPSTLLGLLVIGGAGLLTKRKKQH